MIIQTNTDKNIEGSEALENHVKDTVMHKLGHWTERITRVEVHLNDENAFKTGVKDHRCMMEARPEGAQPLAVTHFAPNVHQAVIGAADRLANLVTNHFGKALER